MTRVWAGLPAKPPGPVRCNHVADSTNSAEGVYLDDIVLCKFLPGAWSSEAGLPVVPPPAYPERLTVTPGQIIRLPGP